MRQANDAPLTGAEGDRSDSARDRALTDFKDWSNYLLVTTTAALGWVGTQATDAQRDSDWFPWSLGFLAASIVAGIATLALIPLVRERLGTATSIYSPSVPFRVLWMVGPEISVPLKTVCYWQHVWFALGMTAYALSALGKPQPDYVSVIVGALHLAVVGPSLFTWVNAHRRARQ